MKLTPEQLENANECGCFECRNKVRTHIRTLQTERDAAVQGLREELKIVNAKNSGRTHYAGCEENHTLCAVARRLDAALKSAGAEP